jgi:pyruvate formate lyase activating enzyme
VETLGSLDGPGVRTVFFLQGCNMKCLYCHNRDSWSLSGGSLYTIDKILSIVERYISYYGKKGGVTFSGGEPLLQCDFLIEILKELKKMNVHTCIDTSGSLFNQKSREVINLADLVILDIKHSKRSFYESLCSFPGDTAFDNLKYLQNCEKAYWIRQVILEGYSDDIKQVEELGSLLQSANPPEKIQLLPFHQMGREKWISLGEKNPLEGVKPPAELRMDQLKSRLYNSFTESRK